MSELMRIRLEAGYSIEQVLEALEEREARIIELESRRDALAAENAQLAGELAEEKKQHATMHQVADDWCQGYQKQAAELAALKREYAEHQVYADETLGDHAALMAELARVKAAARELLAAIRVERKPWVGLLWWTEDLDDRALKGNAAHTNRAVKALEALVEAE